MIQYSPGDRYAWLAMTGAGKTFMTILVITMLVPPRQTDSSWEVWWLDTKDDIDDQRMLEEWGFRDATHKVSARRIYRLRAPAVSTYDNSRYTASQINTLRRDAVVAQAQELADAALTHHGVLLVCDEFQHCCPSAQNAGAALEDVSKRGRGLDVGLAGGIQEPVYVPRQLMSQASHLFIGRLKHLNDVKLARELCPDYAPGWPKLTGDTCPDQFGFWSSYQVGFGENSRWRYWRNAQQWRANVEPGVLESDLVG